MKKYLILFVLTGVISCFGTTVYVNNVNGNDKNSGTRQAPVASIWQALKLVKKSGTIEVANTGKPYQSPYPGVTGRQMYVLTGGTREKPLEIRGNGAVITGLSIIPENKWSKTAEKNILSLPFWPMSNAYRGAKTNYWPDTSAKIWWVNGKAAPNCKSLAELKKTPGGFWWNKAKRQVWFALPEGKKLSDFKIELPANSGFYILVPHVVIRDFYCIFSWNDGFDTAGLGYDGVYRNCISVNNCGQGFSCHAAGSTLYEDCAAIGCNSSGSCDVDQSFSRYMRCIFYKNTYEAGIHSQHNSQHYYSDCIIAGNIPFEQMWVYHSSSQNYFNCLIEGTPGKDVVKFMYNNGIVSFRNCTIRGGKSIFDLPLKGFSSASFRNCIIGGTGEELFKSAPDTFRRLNFSDNAYFNAKSFIYNGRTYTAKTFADYKKINKKDRNSVWLDKEPQGVYRVNKRIVGAHLPSSVLKRFEKLKKLRATAAGIHYEK